MTISIDYTSLIARLTSLSFTRPSRANYSLKEEVLGKLRKAPGYLISQEEKITIRALAEKSLPWIDSDTNKITNVFVKAMYISRFISEVETHPSEGINAVVDIAFPVLKQCNDSCSEFFLLKVCLQEEKERLRSFVSWLTSLLETIEECKPSRDVARAFIKVAFHEREEVALLAKPIIASCLNRNYADEIIRTLGQIKASERVAVVSFATPLMDGIHSARIRALLLRSVASLPSEDRGAICSCAKPLLLKTHFKSDIIDILDALALTNPLKRAKVSECTAALTEGVTDGSLIIAVLRALGRVDSDEIEELCTSCASIGRRSELDSIIDSVLKICRPERARVCELTKRMLSWTVDEEKASSIIEAISLAPFETQRDIASLIEKNINNFTCDIKISELFRFFGFFPERLYEEIFAQLNEMSRLGDISDGSNHLEMIQALMGRNAHLRLATHEYLEQRLLKESVVYRAGALAEVIKEHAYCFEIYDPEHSLPSAAMMVSLILGDVISSKNPYRIHDKMVNERAKHYTPSILSKVLDASIPFFPSAIFSSTKSNLDKETVLRLSRGPLSAVDLFSLVDDFTNRISSLEDGGDVDDYEKALEIRAFVEHISSSSMELLCHNLKDTFFSQLLNAPYEDLIEANKAYLCAVVSFLKSLSPDIPVGGLVSPREETLIKISESIQNCHAGKSEGLILAYNMLPKEFRYTALGDALVDGAQKAKQFILDKLQAVAMNMISSAGPFMHSITASTEEDPQISHSAVYLKNILSGHLGFPHRVDFDLHSSVIPDALLAKSLEELLDAFYFHFPLERVMHDLCRDFASLTSREQRTLFNGINDLIGSRVRISELWDTDEETSEPILTVLGIKECLVSIGVLQEIASEEDSREHKRLKS